MDNQVTPAGPQSKDVHAQWDKMVAGIRAVMRQAKGLPAEDAAILPDGAHGQYVRYALDKNGYLAAGKQHGRRNPHWSKRKLAIKSLSIELFQREFAAHEANLKRIYGKQFDGMQLGDIKLVTARVLLILPGEFNKLRRAAREAARDRHRLARRVNFGLLPGNRARNAHAA